MGLYAGGWVKRFGILLAGLVFFGWGQAFGGDLEPVSKAKTESPATVPESKNLTFSNNRQIEFSLATGWRNDKLDWYIAGTRAGTNPNVLSELDWSDLDSYQVTLANRTRLLRHIYMRGAFSYAAIQNGIVRDSDYGQDNRGAEWSRSLSQSDGDEMWDISAGGGYAFILLDEHLLIAPLLGFSYSKQNKEILLR